MKRLIFSFDGTWNDDRPNLRPTNVAKLHRLIAAADSNGIRQLAYYFSGIASAKDETFAFLKGAVGFGVAANIQNAYAKIAEGYEAGDELFLFGFSRGAYEARSLASLLDLVGIAKDRDFPFSDAWTQYALREKKRNPEKLAELRAAAHFPVRIRCLGVWDTVGNIGNPFLSGTLLSRAHSFHDMRLKPSVDVGLQALSIDERRGTFRPALWSLPEGQSLPAHQTIEQVWFAGTHADVGGGWHETGLSDVALNWMADRASTVAGLAIDKAALAASAHPDPLGAQHDSLTGAIFRLGRLVPFVRLIKQNASAIRPLRRKLIGTWRTGKLPPGEMPLNEALHDSVKQRFNRGVIELRHGRSHQTTYRPANLVPVMGTVTETTGQQAVSGTENAPRRVRVFTVHGTFAYETDWDNWDANDDRAKPGEKRNFINRLSEKLGEQGIVLDQAGHSEFNWSGGNSHHERRTAAIGLKKHIESVLEEDLSQRGPGHYDGVYVIAHSHGGTISRLAMNLWDKNFDYYDPETSPIYDEFKHEDTCETCKRSRNGKVGPSKLPRPDGVITFGSPFVTFQPRPGGVSTARLATWSFRALVTVPLAALFFIAYEIGPFDITSMAWQLTPPGLKKLTLLVWPLLALWLISVSTSHVMAALERWIGKSQPLFLLNAMSQFLKYAAVVLAAVYYYYYAGDRLNELAELVRLDNQTARTWVGWSALAGLAILLLVAFPGAFLSWLRKNVIKLIDKLPAKYDPAEDRPVQYANYHTPGDEPGIGLRFFTVLTWIVQTLAAATAVVLVFGFLLMVLSVLETGLSYSEMGSLLSYAGVSPASDLPGERDKFIAIIDGLTAFPKAVWTHVFGATWLPTLGEMNNRREVAWYVPFAIALATLVIFVFLMPFVALTITIVYLASAWLRGSGLVFGSEKLSWTIANSINVHRIANANSMLRVIPFAPTAWWRREIAHCYYYRSAEVIDDVARKIANWQDHKPTKRLGLGNVLSQAGRVLVIALFSLSILAVSIPIASTLVSGMTAFGAMTGAPDWAMTGPGALPDPKNAQDFTNRGEMYSKIKRHDLALSDYGKAVALEPTNSQIYDGRAKAYMRKGDVVLALADYTKAIELDPKVALYYFGRARALKMKGDLTASIAEYTLGLELDPANAKAFGARAAVHLANSENDLALADYAKAAELEPGLSLRILTLAAVKYGSGDYKGAGSDLARIADGDDAIAAYVWIFRSLTKRRLGEADTPAPPAQATGPGNAAWPAPVVELMQGKRSAQSVADAARTPAQTCEASYYISQWHTLSGNPSDGQMLLREAASKCPDDLVEYLAAVAELKRPK